MATQSNLSIGAQSIRIMDNNLNNVIALLEADIRETTNKTIKYKLNFAIARTLKVKKELKNLFLLLEDIKQ